MDSLLVVCWIWAKVVLVSNEPQFELVATYRVQRAIKEEVMKILMAINNIEIMKRVIYEHVEISALFQFIVSGWAKFTDYIMISSRCLNFNFYGSPGRQQMHLLNAEVNLFTKEYFLHTFMNVYLALRFLKWIIA